MCNGNNLFSDGDVGCAPCVTAAGKAVLEWSCDVEITVIVALTAILSSLAVTAIWMIFATK